MRAACTTHKQRSPIMLNWGEGSRHRTHVCVCKREVTPEAGGDNHGNKGHIGQEEPVERDHLLRVYKATVVDRPLSGGVWVFFEFCFAF